jgi:hypothetical protein
MGVTAGLSSARARIDERMTSAKDRKHASCRVRRWRGRRGRKPAEMCSAKKHTADDTHTKERTVHLTLVSSCVQRRLGAEHVKRLSAHRRGGASSIVRCIIVRVEGSGDGE